MGIEGEEAYGRRAYFWNLIQPILWQVREFYVCWTVIYVLSW